VITPDEERRISKNPNTDIEAYDYILRAKDLEKTFIEIIGTVFRRYKK